MSSRKQPEEEKYRLDNLEYLLEKNLYDENNY